MFTGPLKRSVTIAGHETSISLEPIFWDALRAQAEARALPINALIAQIDLQRISVDAPPNLASAIRIWLFDRAARGDLTPQQVPRLPRNLGEHGG